MRACEICGKTYKKAVKRKKLRGKFNPVKEYFQKPNLQYLKLGRKRVLICTSCRRKILKGEIELWK